MTCVKAEDVDGYTPLCAAAACGKAPLVSMLLDCWNVDINHRVNGEATSLFLAAEAGHLSVVQCLIQRKADLETETIDNWRALSIAAQNQHMEVVAALREAGAVNVPRLLWLRVQAGNVQEVELMLRTPPGVDCEASMPKPNPNANPNPTLTLTVTLTLVIFNRAV